MQTVIISEGINNPYGFSFYGKMSAQPDADNRVFVQGFLLDENDKPTAAVSGFYDIDEIGTAKFFSGTYCGKDDDGKERIIVKGKELVSLGADVTRTDGTPVVFGVGCDLVNNPNSISITAGAKQVLVTFDPDDSSGASDTINV